MNRILFLSLLVGLAAYESGDRKYFTTIGFGQNNPEPFLDICPDDQFEYKNKLVNSFFTITGFQQTHEIDKYALEDSVNYHRLFNSPQADQLEAIRKDYHNRLIELFGSEYLNDPSNKKNVIYQKLDSLRTNLTSFKGKGKNPLADTILDEQSRKIEAARNLSSVLYAFRTAKSPNSEDVQEVFAQHLEVVLEKIGKNARMVLSKENIAETITMGIYQFNRYKAIKHSKLFNNWRKDSGMIHYYMHIPFEQQGSTSGACVKAKDLPDFYQFKGKVNHWNNFPNLLDPGNY